MIIICCFLGLFILYCLFSILFEYIVICHKKMINEKNRRKASKKFKEVILTLAHLKVIHQTEKGTFILKHTCRKPNEDNTYEIDLKYKKDNFYSILSDLKVMLLEKYYSKNDYLCWIKEKEINQALNLGYIHRNIETNNLK